MLLSDGEDNQSRVTREEAIEMAQRAEVIVYAISTNISGIKMRGDKVLERIADATGGRVFFPFKLQDVATAFTEIQDELRSQYAVAYKPAGLWPMGAFAASPSSHCAKVCGYAAAADTTRPNAEGTVRIQEANYPTQAKEACGLRRMKPLYAGKPGRVRACKRNQGENYFTREKGR